MISTTLATCLIFLGILLMGYGIHSLHKKVEEREARRISKEYLEEMYLKMFLQEENDEKE